MAVRPVSFPSSDLSGLQEVVVQDEERHSECKQDHEGDPGELGDGSGKGGRPDAFAGMGQRQAVQDRLEDRVQ